MEESRKSSKSSFLENSPSYGLVKENYSEKLDTSGYSDPWMVRKPSQNKGIMSNFTNPTTHIGLYFAGLGWATGTIGGLVRESAVSLLSYGPSLFESASRNQWSETLYITGNAITTILYNSAYFSAIGAGIGYLGGSFVSKRIFGKFGDFFKPTSSDDFEE